jgi:hypothetical protein
MGFSSSERSNDPKPRKHHPPRIERTCKPTVGDERDGRNPNIIQKRIRPMQETRIHGNWIASDGI